MFTWVPVCFKEQHAWPIYVGSKPSGFGEPPERTSSVDPPPPPPLPPYDEGVFTSGGKDGKGTATPPPLCLRGRGSP